MKYTEYCKYFDMKSDEITKTVAPMRELRQCYLQ